MIDVLLALLLACAHLHGLATYYGPPAFVNGDIMANGEPLHLDAPTVAVDVSLYHLLDRQAVILTECGTWHKVKVADTGRLYKVGGWFQYGVRDGQVRYWPVNIETENGPILGNPYPSIAWLEDEAYRIVADFPSKYFASIACDTDAWGNGDTMKVWVWIVD